MESAMNNGMCRCCASEGTFKDVKTKYSWMGQEEIYADMLKECFDINLIEAEDGDNGGICEVCVTQLRNAANFKKQVLHTEEQFKKHLDEKLFSTNIVKLEIEKDDALESDNNMSDDYSAPEFEVPIKEEKPEETKPKKRAAAVKATTSKAKKAKVEVGETSKPKSNGCETSINVVDPNVSNSILKCLLISKVKEEDNKDSIGTVSKKRNTKHSRTSTLQNIMKIANMHYEMREIDKHLQNIKMILLNSNATPFRSHDVFGYGCSFCSQQYSKAADLKSHTIEEHNSARSGFMKGYGLSGLLVKLDITGLQCSLCTTYLDALDQLLHHLRSEHDKEVYTDINNHIVPFKFETEDLRCALCTSDFDTFKLLLVHMNIHYRNYTCDICNAPFINKRTLQSHNRSHKKGDFHCSYCLKVFDTNTKKNEHEKAVHVGDPRRNKCPHCSEKFVSYARKLEHMVQEHGAKPRVLKCNACDETFVNKESLTRHTKRDHLLERRHECDKCDMKFYARKELDRHMVKHTKLRKYRCDVCLKAYGRKNTLREHMRIHADDRRFKCEHCGQAFVQKCSWKSHLRSKHDVIL